MAYLLAKESIQRDFARHGGAWGEDPTCYPEHVTYWVNGGPTGTVAIENETDANNFVRESAEFFLHSATWVEYNEEDRPVCRISSADFQEVVQRMARMCAAAARFASDEALATIEVEVAKQYIQTIHRVVQRETTSKFYLRSGVVKEPGQTVIDSCLGWFRIDAVNDTALEAPDGLIGTVCKAVLNQKRPPSPVFTATCMMICENVARMTRGLASFQVAMDRGILKTGLHCLSMTNSAVIKHATRLLNVCAGEPTIVCKLLAEGTAERKTAEHLQALPGLNAAAREEVAALLNIAVLCEHGLAVKDTNFWVGEELFPLPKAHACAHCRAPDAKQRCSRCNETYYCNGECQKKHWREHKMKCPSIPQLRQPDMKGLRRLASGYMAKHADRLKQTVLAAVRTMQDGEGEAGADMHSLSRRVLLCLDLAAWQDSVVSVGDVAESVEGGVPPLLVELAEEAGEDHAQLVEAIQAAASRVPPKHVTLLVRAPGPDLLYCLYAVHMELKKSGKAKKKKAKAKAGVSGEGGAAADVAAA